ncbi:MAG: cobalt-precorrin-5B (C(1))-methyltransferase CbiD [Tissierellaceae bacterium]
MSLDLYVVKDGKNLRCGYTTGSCAAGAAKAAALMLETRKVIDYIEIDTPAGIRLKLKVNDQIIQEDRASCSIIKDAGDDPDATDGIKIFVEVSRSKDSNIDIDGGFGIGRITSQSLFGEVGEAAINKVPKQMIKKELREISDSGYNVIISAPLGKEIGKKTFNKNIGIEGGISIIGTKGIVYPMSEEALLKTIYMEVDGIVKNWGKDNILLVPGNYGENLAESIDIDIPKVKVSNFIGDSLLYVYNKGFKTITLLGHIGKFSKLAIGVFNTHSKVCDARMEAFIYYLALMGASMEFIQRIDTCLTAEEALNICCDEGFGNIVHLMENGAEKRIKKYLKDEDIDIKVKIYSMERGLNIC